MDKVFLLSDVDEFYDQLEKIFKGNQTDVQGRWVVSNPCFEIWLYYCYLDSPEKVLGCLKTEPITTRSKKMKALGNTLVSGGLNPCLAFENMLNGIEHTGGLALLLHLIDLAKKQGNNVTLQGVNDKVYTLAKLYNLPADVLPR